MHYLYKITNLLNNKIYIGQAVNTERRWTDHKWNSKQKNPIQYISRAMRKYGIENFIFEVIATCCNQDNANEIESILIQQYNSRNKEFGYNIKPGGNNAPQAEETKEKIRQATIKQIVEKGHPAQGTKRTPEQIQTLIKARQEHPVEYTPEIRQHMSDAHLGKVIPEVQRQRMAEAIKEQWKTRGDYDSKKCEAPGCEVSGKAKYKIINGTRYCNKHGLRMLRYNRLDTIDS